MVDIKQLLGATAANGTNAQSAQITNEKIETPEMGSDLVSPGSATADENSDGVIDEKDEIINILKSTINKIIDISSKNKKKAPDSAAVDKDSIATKARSSAELLDPRFESETPSFLR